MNPDNGRQGCNASARRRKKTRRRMEESQKERKGEKEKLKI